MGGSSAKNLPPPQYVGFWSGRNGTVMIIDRDGRINYSSSVSLHLKFYYSKVSF